MDMVWIDIEDRICLTVENKFAAFLDKYSVELVARKRTGGTDAMRWYVSTRTDLLEVIGDRALTSCSGNGATPEEALVDFGKKISGQNVLIGGFNGIMTIAPEWGN